MNLDMENLEEALEAVQSLILNYRKNLCKKPVYPITDYNEIEQKLTSELPMEGSDYAAVISETEQNVIPGCTKIGHPGFLAWMNNSSCDAGILGEIINTGLAQVPFTFKGGKSMTAIEHIVPQWFCRMFNFPAQSTGSIVSGGTVANLTALTVARETMFPDSMQEGIQNNSHPLRVYMSTQGHVSVERSVGLLGIGTRNIVKIGTDANFRIDTDALEGAINKDRANGCLPFCVIAQAGSASTGAVDDIDRLADICEKYHLWLHADAAYGGGAILTEQGKQLLKGIHRADSVITDPHKWFYMPVESGLVLFKEKKRLTETFLKSSCNSYRGSMDSVNLMNTGIQIAQTSKAFKIWFAMKVYGLNKIKACIENDLFLAKECCERLKNTGKWDIVNDVSLSTVCMRYTDDSRDESSSDALQHNILNQLEQSGKALLSSAIVSGRVCIRVCFANHRTTLEDVTGLVQTLTNIGDVLSETQTTII
ncbi:MAG: aminotransferase class I/II-fold pyridoxal phosphate-dependent enzyme [Desulfobacterales bacterium]|nr:aminotransferase class I/II-fold pyridoxal phosphate-dependent enzyme [Desulfobacterales bacterium]